MGSKIIGQTHKIIIGQDFKPAHGYDRDGRRAKTRQKQEQYARIAAVNTVLNKNISVDTLTDGFCVSRGTVYAWLAAYDRDGLDDLADDARPGRPPFVQRARLEEIVGGAKRFTALGFVELVEKRTGVKYS